MEVFLHKKDMPYNCKLCNFRHIEDNFCCVIGDVVPNDFLEKRNTACTLKVLNEKTELTPRYKKGDEVYFVICSIPDIIPEDGAYLDTTIRKTFVKKVYIGKQKISYEISDDWHRYNEAELFSSEEEAQLYIELARLED